LLLCFHDWGSLLLYRQWQQQRYELLLQRRRRLLLRRRQLLRLLLLRLRLQCMRQPLLLRLPPCTHMAKWRLSQARDSGIEQQATCEHVCNQQLTAFRQHKNPASRRCPPTLHHARVLNAPECRR